MATKNPVTSRTGRYPLTALSWAPTPAVPRGTSAPGFVPPMQDPMAGLHPSPMPAPAGLEGIWDQLPDNLKTFYQRTMAAYPEPQVPQDAPINYMPQGPGEMFSGVGPMALPEHIRGAGAGGYFLASLANSLANSLGASGREAYQSRISQQQSERVNRASQYQRQVNRRDAMVDATVRDAMTATRQQKPEVPGKMYPVMQNDWNDMMKAGAIPQRIVDEYGANNGALSKESFDSFQKGVDNLRSGQASDRAANAASRLAQTSPADLETRAAQILDGIASGMLNPSIELYGTNRDGMKSLLAAGAVARGLDLAQLRQDWAGKTKAINSVNGPQQLRMRQAAEAIPVLIDQMMGKRGRDGTRRGGVISQLGNTQLQPLNVVRQTAGKMVGRAGALRRWNILRAKLATEQTVLINGGNAPDVHTKEHFLSQYDPTIPTSDLADAMDASEQSVLAYRKGIGNVGPVTPSAPYNEETGFSNPFGGKTYRFGTNPAAGTTGPGSAQDLSGKIRVVAPDGTPGKWPANKPLPPGYKRVQ